MKQFVLSVCLLFVLSVHLWAQQEISNTQLKLKDNTENSSLLIDKSSKTGLPSIIAVGLIFVIINPELVIENKKVYFGLTKELSIGKYPYGRLAFEYTYIFRD